MEGKDGARVSDYDGRLKDYVDVAERIAEFRQRYPEGSLQAQVLRWPEKDFPYLAVEARAYRSPTDERPGVGLAWENVPGKTPYTKDSELQNAETSAWGRAIVAVLAADTRKGIASRQEVARTQSSARPRKGAPQGPSAPEESDGSGDGGAKGKGAPSPGSRTKHAPGCTFPGATDLRPSGEPMPTGKVRCTGCGVTLLESEVA